MGGNTGIKFDPKIEAFHNYRDNMHKNFRFTPGNIAKTVVFAVVIPTFLYLKIKQEVMVFGGQSTDPTQRTGNMFSVFPSPKQQLTKEEDF